MRVPSLTEKIRAAGDFNSIYVFKWQQDETLTIFSPCVLSSENIIYVYALWV